ncbi:MAG: oligogalacturonate lyase family protein [Acidobacteria bacterium]|nr:oligogalacturonate lyase family protein [Acidobacteriota bacterium]
MRGDREGVVWSDEQVQFRDAATGVLVRQMTSYPSINHPTYFLQSSFTPDNRQLLFTSYRSGSPQLFLTGFPEGETRQLTDAEPIHPFSPAIHPDGGRVFFVRGGELWELSLETLEERCIVAFADAQLGECSLGAGGDWLAAAIKQGDVRGIAAGKADGSQWRIIPFPRTVIHPQFHPLEPEWIEFSGDPAPRMHRVRRDGTGMECLLDHGNDQFIVHETFLGVTGHLVYTVWPGQLWTLDWQTRERKQIASFNAWHITPDRAGMRILCDTNHPDEGIFLVDVVTGGRRLVCLSEATNQGSQWKKSRYALAEDFAAARGGSGLTALSWMETVDTVYGPQWTHPHPSFSSNERYVAYASDRTGRTQVYVAELN